MMSAHPGYGHIYSTNKHYNVQLIVSSGIVIQPQMTASLLFAMHPDKQLLSQVTASTTATYRSLGCNVVISFVKSCWVLLEIIWRT